MRILGYLDHPILKITVFKMDTRLSIKFENGTFEQTYKFRVNDHLNSIPELRALVDETFLAKVQARFAAMERDFNAALERHLPPPSADELPSII